MVNEPLTTPLALAVSSPGAGREIPSKRRAETFSLGPKPLAVNCTAIWRRNSTFCDSAATRSWVVAVEVLAMLPEPWVMVWVTASVHWVTTWVH